MADLGQTPICAFMPMASGGPFQAATKTGAIRCRYT